MKRKGSASIQRGQAITFRLPSDTPDHIVRQLQHLKDQERRNFSSRIAEFVLQGVCQSLTKEKEMITLPLPRQLGKDQRNWLKHSHSEALLGNIVYQLLADPVRATSILASLNSNALDIEEALYLQEDIQAVERISAGFETDVQAKTTREDVDFEAELDNFNWEQAKLEQAVTKEEAAVEEREDSVDDLLGGFLDSMNK